MLPTLKNVKHPIFSSVISQECMIEQNYVETLSKSFQHAESVRPQRTETRARHSITPMLSERTDGVLHRIDTLLEQAQRLEMTQKKSRTSETHYFVKLLTELGGPTDGPGRWSLNFQSVRRHYLWEIARWDIFRHFSFERREEEGRVDLRKQEN